MFAAALPIAAQQAGQSASRNRPFDIRDLESHARLLSGGKKSADPSPVAAQVRAAVEGFRTPDGLAVSSSFGRFGLPRRLSAAGSPLSLPRTGAARDAALAFLAANPQAFPFLQTELDGMRVTHESEAGELHVVRLQQTLGGLPVYGARIHVAVDAQGRVIQVSAGDAAPGLTLGAAARLSGEDAIRAALRSVGFDAVHELEAAGVMADGRRLFRNPAAPQLDPAVVDAVVFPLPSGEGRNAWRVLADGPNERREIVIDAADGRMLRNVNLVRYAGSARVWRTNPNTPRELVQFPAGWLPENGRITSGNNVVAFVDLDADGLPDPVEGDGLVDGYAQADASGLFDRESGTGFDFDLEHMAAAVTNAFYFANLAHDYFYEMGFKEADGAMQVSNGNLGGVAGDPMRISLLDIDLVTGPAVIPAPDGMRPRMRLPTLLTDDGVLHSAFDGDAVIHEYAHAVTERLVGGADDVTCLGFGTQGTAISEGVSDYFAGSFFDDALVAEYLGVSRLDRMDTNTRSYESLGDPYFEAHADGEIVAAILWQIRAQLGAATADRLVLNALKILPCTPTFVDLRDALLTAGGATRRTALWRIFAPRGLGASARGSDEELNADTLFDAAFDLPPDLATGNNRAPIFQGSPGDFALANEDFIYTARAQDPNGDPLTYQLLDGPAGATLDTKTGRLSYRGTFVSQRVVIEATDGKGGRTTHGLMIYGGSLLTPGRSLSITGDRYSTGIGLITVTGAREALQVTTRGGQGDTDITLWGPLLSETFVSDRSGTAETITAPNPTFPALWVAFVDGARAFSGVTFLADFVQSQNLPLNSTRTGLSGAQTSETFFKITVPSGTPRLRITASGGTGDADLYLSRSKMPACYVVFSFDLECDADRESLYIGNTESVEVLNPAAGDWYLNLQGYRVFSGLTLDVSTSAGSIQLNGASDAASYGPSIASGGIGTLFGTGFTDQTLEGGSLPLATELGGVRVFVDGAPAGLFYVSPTQINFQMPTAAGTGNVNIVAVNGVQASQHLAAVVREQVPRLFTFSLDGALLPIVTHADGSLVLPTSPAAPGEILVAYLTGAAITPQPPDGQAASAEPLSYTVDPAEVTVGGAAATTLFSGATPGFVGLIQVNFQMPETLPAGNDIVLRFGEASTVPLPLPMAR